jgi:prepilin signal peptidase PulO-like enzyme (type II secretory pathway)
MNLPLLVPLLIGWIAGWLINYLSDVLPVTRRLGQAACPRCGAQFKWLDYFLLRACPNGHRRNIRAWLVQGFMMVSSVYLWLNPPAKLDDGYWLGFLLLAYFALVFVIDMEHRLILHVTSLFGSFLGLWAGITANGISDTIYGGAGGLLIMLALYYLGALFTRARAKRLKAAGQEADDEEALGAGDVILAGVLGLALGWPLIWFGLLIAILLGGAVSVLLLLWLVITRRYSKNALMIFIPYGPYFLVSASLIIYFPKFLAATLFR